jgi:hypothetical protein
MSTPLASVTQNRSESLTSLVLIGGRECIPGKPRSWQNPDLWVKGGAIIDKGLCVGGNIGTDGFLSGNLISDVILVSTIEERFLGEGIDVFGDVRFHGNIIGGNISGGGGVAGVSSWSAGTTGFAPSGPTTGVVTLSGTLNVGHGGTGLTATPTNGQLPIGNGTGYTLSTITVKGHLLCSFIFNLKRHFAFSLSSA